jgi:hypothetical protein
MANPLKFFGVPKGIPFDAAQDKLTLLSRVKLGMSLALFEFGM